MKKSADRVINRSIELRRNPFFVIGLALVVGLAMFLTFGFFLLAPQSRHFFETIDWVVWRAAFLILWVCWVSGIFWEDVSPEKDKFRDRLCVLSVVAILLASFHLPSWVMPLRFISTPDSVACLVKSSEGKIQSGICLRSLEEITAEVRRHVAWWSEWAEGVKNTPQ